MKKTLLALAVMAATSSVSAAEIYSTETSKVSLKGEVDGLVTKASGLDADVSYWAKIQLDAEHKLSDTLTGFASFEIEGDAGYLALDDVYAGVKTDTWGAAIGETFDYAGSTNAIEKDDIVNELDYFGSLGHPTESKGKGIAFKGEFVEGLTLVADVNTVADEAVDNTYGISADYAFADYTVGAAYVSGDADFEVAGISASAEFSGLYLATTYTMFDGNGDSNYAGYTLGVAAAYQLDDIRLYTTYGMQVNDEENGVSLASDLEDTNLVLGADYAYTDNITLFAEYQTTDLETTGTDEQKAIAGVYYAF